MSRIPDFLDSLEKMKEVHIRKNEDYATSANPFSNFDFAESITKFFSLERDKVFATLVSVKLARLATLLSSDRVPNNESVDDSFIDLANYVLLWKARVKESKIEAIMDLLIDVNKELTANAIDDLPPFQVTPIDNVVFRCQVHNIIHCATCIEGGNDFYPTSHTP